MTVLYYHIAKSVNNTEGYKDTNHMCTACNISSVHGFKRVEHIK